MTEDLGRSDSSIDIETAGQEALGETTSTLGSTLGQRIQTAQAGGQAGGETLVLSAANAGQVIQTEPGMQIEIAFDPSEVQLALEGADLILTFADGGTIVLQDFAVNAETGEGAAFILQDGQILAGDIVIAQLRGAPDEQPFETAAGPAGGSGGTNYSDDLGEGMGGFGLGATGGGVSDMTLDRFTPEGETGGVTITGPEFDFEGFTLEPIQESFLPGVGDDEFLRGRLADLFSDLNLDRTSLPWGDGPSQEPVPLSQGLEDYQRVGNDAGAGFSVSSGSFTVDFRNSVAGETPISFTEPDGGFGNLTSLGEAVTIEIAADGQSIIGYVEGSDRPVFAAILEPTGDDGAALTYSYHFVLLDSLDYVEGAAISLPVEITADAKLADSVTASFDLSIEDDGPVIENLEVGQPRSEMELSVSETGEGSTSIGLFEQLLGEMLEGQPMAANIEEGFGQDSLPWPVIARTGGDFGFRYGADGPADSDTDGIGRDFNESVVNPSLSIVSVNAEGETAWRFANGEGESESQILTSGGKEVSLTKLEAGDHGIDGFTIFLAHTGEFSLPDNEFELQSESQGNHLQGEPVFLLVLNNQTGAFEIVFFETLDHPLGLEVPEGTEWNDQFRFDFSVQIQDGDGSLSQEALAQIYYRDDGPEQQIINVEIASEKTLLGDDCKVLEGCLDGIFGADGPAEGGGYAWTAIDGQPFLVVRENDGEGTVSVDDNQTVELTSAGEEVIITFGEKGGETDYTTILGKTACGESVFTLTLEQDGDYKFELHRQLDHPKEQDGQGDTLWFNFRYTTTDRDGDSITNNQLRIEIADSQPVACDVKICLEEKSARPGNLLESSNLGVDTIGATIHQITVGEVTYTLTEIDGAMTMMPQDGCGEPIGLWNGIAKIPTEHGKIFVQVMEDGDSRFDLGDFLYKADQVDHTPADSIAKDEIGFVYKDGDGDTDDGNLIVRITDDCPEVERVKTFDRVAHESRVPELGSKDGGHSKFFDADAGGLIKVDFGKDGPHKDQPIRFADTDHMPKVEVNGEEVCYTLSDCGTELTAYAGGDKIFTVTLSPVDGAGRLQTFKYEFELHQGIDHGDRFLKDWFQKLDFGFIVTDGDGSEDGGSFTVKVADDRPEVGRGEESTASACACDEDQDLPEGVDVGDAKPCAYASGVLAFTYGADAIGADLTVWQTGKDSIETDKSWQEGKLYLKGTLGGEVVYLLEVDPEGGGDGKASYQFWQFAEIEGKESLSFGLKAEDGDGDKDFGKIKIDLEYEFPKAEEVEVPATEVVILPEALKILEDQVEGFNAEKVEYFKEFDVEPLESGHGYAITTPPSYGTLYLYDPESGEVRTISADDRLEDGVEVPQNGKVWWVAETGEGTPTAVERSVDLDDFEGGTGRLGERATWGGLTLTSNKKIIFDSENGFAVDDTVWLIPDIWPSFPDKNNSEIDTGEDLTIDFGQAVTDVKLNLNDAEDFMVLRWTAYDEKGQEIDSGNAWRQGGDGESYFVEIDSLKPFHELKIEPADTFEFKDFFDWSEWFKDDFTLSGVEWTVPGEETFDEATFEYIVKDDCGCSVSDPATVTIEPTAATLVIGSNAGNSNENDPLSGSSAQVQDGNSVIQGSDEAQSILIGDKGGSVDLALVVDTFSFGLVKFELPDGVGGTRFKFTELDGAKVFRKGADGIFTEVKDPEQSSFSHDDAESLYLKISDGKNDVDVTVQGLEWAVVSKFLGIPIKWDWKPKGSPEPVDLPPGHHQALIAAKEDLQCLRSKLVDAGFQSFLTILLVTASGSVEAVEFKWNGADNFVDQDGKALSEYISELSTSGSDEPLNPQAVAERIEEAFGNEGPGKTIIVTSPEHEFSGSDLDSLVYEYGEGSGDEPRLNAETIANDLSDAAHEELGETNGSELDPENIGKDVIEAGDGGALIFGDAINADWMLEHDGFKDHLSGDLREGDGYEIILSYLRSLNDGNDPTSEQVVDFIKEYRQEFIDASKNDSRGGDDTIHDGAGDDWILGQGGDDTIFLGEGENRAWGGEGKDTFVLTSAEGHSTIEDFTSGEDTVAIDLSQFLGIGDSENLEDYFRVDGDADGPQEVVFTSGEEDQVIATVIGGGLSLDDLKVYTEGESGEGSTV